MKILFFSTRWGSDDLTLEEFLKKSAGAGYDGIEIGIPATTSADELEQIFAGSERHGLKVILQHYDTYDADFEIHRYKYARWFEKIKSFKPFLVNSQTGKDFFTIQQNLELIRAAYELCGKNGIPLVHETHRNKFSFACHITFEYLQAAPDLRLALDISHWVAVAESYLEDQQQAVELALARTGHIHSRIGFPEGPQVPDPRDPLWSHAVETHCTWWDKVVLQRQQEVPGGILSITPEFGPHPYMTYLPFTQKPVADQWDINLHMMHLLKERYRSFSGTADKRFSII